jgi:hypothetical protein
MSRLHLVSGAEDCRGGWAAAGGWGQATVLGGPKNGGAQPRRLGGAEVPMHSDSGPFDPTHPSGSCRMPSRMQIPLASQMPVRHTPPRGAHSIAR